VSDPEVCTRRGSDSGWDRRIEGVGDVSVSICCDPRSGYDKTCEGVHEENWTVFPWT
jgi:hypothetical protein